MSCKKIPVCFYYLTPVTNQTDGSEFCWDNFLTDLNNMLNDLQSKELSERKFTFLHDEKVIWLDSYKQLTQNEIDIVIKSAKYNHIRTVIDTSTMIERGFVKTSADGDEEKTHLCLRYYPPNEQMICLFGNNFYGVGIGKVLEYLSTELNTWYQRNQEKRKYSFEKEIMPGDEFLTELKKMNAISLVTLSITYDEFTDDFCHLANRDEVRKTVDVQLKKAKRNVSIPQNLVENYYADMDSEHKIKKIAVEGKNGNGAIRIDTDAIQKKQAITVEISEVTKEIDSDSFFTEAQTMLEAMRNPQNE